MPNQTGQSIDGVIDGLMSMATTIYGATFDDATGNYFATFNGQQLLVCEGDPDSYQPDLIVSVASDVREPVDAPTLGTTRSRERAAEIDIIVWAFVPGSGVAQRAARKQCTAMTDLIDDFFRTSPNEKFGGACYDSRVTNIAGPVLTQATNAESGNIAGRLAATTVTVTAKIRY